MKESLLFPWINHEVNGWYKPEITIEKGVVTLFIDGVKVTEGVMVKAPQEAKAFAELRRDIHKSRIVCTALDHALQCQCLAYIPLETEIENGICDWCHRKSGGWYECTSPKLKKLLSRG